ncbi:glycine-rich domain-containing protein, partial [Actinomadura sp. WAC 06369]|uniref:glycine-rich domain-containing protein n=1 Tax=Actinomadura sp. WAC 06369 TaxID=2203193 RepID=UPI001002FE28
MTLTVEPAVRTAEPGNPRELLGYAPGLFDKLAAYVAKDRQVTLPYAEQVMEQTLIWLQACADNPTLRIGMTEAVDHGWHAFLLHSQDYAEFCDRAFGGYLHHVPPAPGQSMT